MSERGPWGPQGFWILITALSAIAFGMSPVLVRWLTAAGMEPVAISFARFALTAVVMLPFLGLRRGRLGATLMGMVAGAAMGYGWVGHIIALDRTTIPTPSVFYMSFPVFTVLFMLAILNRLPDGRSFIAALMAAAAIWVVLPADKVEDLTWPVILVALSAPLSFGFAITVLNGWLWRLSPVERLACVPLGACIGLVPGFFLNPDAVAIPEPGSWLTILAFAAGTVLVPGFLYVVAAPRIGALRSATVGAIELPAMFAFALWLFNEPATEREIAAALLVIVATLVVSVSDKPMGRPPTG